MLELQCELRVANVIAGEIGTAVMEADDFEARLEQICDFLGDKF